MEIINIIECLSWILFFLGYTWVDKTSDDRVLAAHVNDLQDEKTDKDTLWINVKDYGAIGDGIVDDTVAIQAAIDLLGTSGGTIFIPRGEYLISAHLDITEDDVNIKGEGRASIIITNNNADDIFQIIGVPTTLGVVGTLIENLSLHGPNAGVNSAIYVKCGHQNVFRNVWIGDRVSGGKGLGFGIYFDGSSFNDVDNNIVQGCLISFMLVHGIYLNATAAPAACEENTISGNIVSYCGASGIAIKGNRNTIVGNTVEECGEQGIVVTEDWNTITGNTCCENTRNGISLENCDDCVVVGNICKDNDFANTTTYDGIALFNSEKNLIIGNRCINNDRYEIQLDVNSNYNVVVGNGVQGADHVGTILDSGTGNRLRDNEGFVSENSGISGAIATGATVAHGLGGTPAYVSIVAAEAGPTDIYVTAVGAANFAVNFGGGGNKTFYWRASIASSK